MNFRPSTLAGKQAAVLRLLRGEDLEALSRELGVTAATLSRWRGSLWSPLTAASLREFSNYESLRLSTRNGSARPLETWT